MVPVVHLYTAPPSPPACSALHRWKEKTVEAAGSVVCYCLPLLPCRATNASLTARWKQTDKRRWEGEKKTWTGYVTLAARVMLRSFITSSNAAVSSACFWLCKAIFSLNFRGLFEVAMFRSSAPFSFNGQRQVNRGTDTGLPVRDVDIRDKHQGATALSS